MIELFFGLARGVELLCVGLVFGRIVFHLLVPSDILPSSRRLLAWAALAAIAWLIACCSSMVESLNPAQIFTAVAQTSFGHYWSVRALILTLLAVFFPRLSGVRSAKYVLLPAMLAALLAGSLTSHAGQAEGALRALKVTTDWLHSISVGAWTGGLASLTRYLHPERNLPQGMRRAAVRTFSRLATASVATIFLTGLYLAYSGGVWFDNLLAETYSQLVTGKVAIFSLALGAAAINQFIHLRQSHVLTEDVLSARIRREARIELALVVLVFGLAGVLSRTMPLQ